MAELTLPGPGVNIAERLGLARLAPRPTPRVELDLDQERLLAAFPGLQIGKFERSARDGTARLRIVLTRDGEFAASLDISRLPLVEDMPRTVEGQFSLISGPLDGLAALPPGKLDLLARSSRRDTFAVGVRGSFIALARLHEGLRASELAQTALDLIFADVQ